MYKSRIHQLVNYFGADTVNIKCLFGHEMIYHLSSYGRTVLVDAFVSDLAPSLSNGLATYRAFFWHMEFLFFSGAQFFQNFFNVRYHVAGPADYYRVPYFNTQPLNL